VPRVKRRPRTEAATPAPGAQQASARGRELQRSRPPRFGACTRARGVERGARAGQGRRTRHAGGRGSARRAAYWARERTRWCHAREPRAAGREGPAAAQAGQWCRPRTARV